MAKFTNDLTLELTMIQHEEALESFVNQLSELLKKVNLSHRIYFYTSEYFKRLIVKGLITGMKLT